MTDREKYIALTKGAAAFLEAAEKFPPGDWYRQSLEASGECLLEHRQELLEKVRRERAAK